MGEVRKTVLEVHADERGWVVDPMVPPFPNAPLGQAHIASLEPGAVRGNHVHPSSAEYVFVWGGTSEVTWRSEDGELKRETVGPGKMVVFEIPPGIPHTVVNVGSGTVYLLAYYLGAAEGKWPETERVELI